MRRKAEMRVDVDKNVMRSGREVASLRNELG